MSLAAVPVGRTLTTLLQRLISQLPKALPSFGKISKAAVTGGGAGVARTRSGGGLLATVSSKPVVVTAIGGATILGTTGLFTQTEGGKQALKTLEDISLNISNVGQDVTEFLSDNPIILPLALGIGLIVVLKA